LKEAQQSGEKIMIREGFDFAVPYADIITDMELSGVSYSLLDATVPFYQIALHGTVDYTGPALNLSSDWHTEFLRCVEYGAGLNFTFMDTDTKILQDSVFSCYASANYSAWKDEAFAMITRYQKDMTGLNRQQIVDHEKLTDKVAVTTYADGTKVYVNYGGVDYAAGAVKVPARDYLVEREVGQ
jgi:hypothetical protein